MQNLLPWPAQRITYPGIDNPMFDQDIEALTGMLLQAVQASLGIGAADFFIVSGCDYNNGTNQYASGIVFMNGSFYAVTGPFPAGSYLTPVIQDALTVDFDDSESRSIYGAQIGLVGQVAGAGGSPQFGSTMNQYRIGNKYLQANIVSLLATQAALGAAAFLPVGPGGVASYTDPRLVGDANFFANTYALRSAVILKGAGTAYTPVDPTDPINKGYVDNSFFKFLAKGFNDLGDADSSGGTNHTISMGTTLATTAYKVLFSTMSLSADPHVDSVFTEPVIRNKTASSFDIFYRETAGGVQHVAVDWIVIPQ